MKTNKKQIEILEKGELLEDLSLDMIIGGAGMRVAMAGACDFCNSCGTSNNSNNGDNDNDNDNDGGFDGRVRYISMN